MNRQQLSYQSSSVKINQQDQLCQLQEDHSARGNITKGYFRYLLKQAHSQCEVCSFSCVYCVVHSGTWCYITIL